MAEERLGGLDYTCCCILQEPGRVDWERHIGSFAYSRMRHSVLVAGLAERQLVAELEHVACSCLQNAAALARQGQEIGSIPSALSSVAQKVPCTWLA
jgi:hypothetical protein